MDNAEVHDLMNIGIARRAAANQVVVENPRVVEHQVAGRNFAFANPDIVHFVLIVWLWVCYTALAELHFITSAAKTR